jgi:spore coat protein Z
MCNNNSDDCKCISEILTIINILQQNAECGDACLDTCDRGFLGCCATSVSCNTRPVMLYTCGSNGVAWSMPISKDAAETGTSSIFRIEKVDGCCATFRVLVPNTDTTEPYPYEATNSFFTMNLNCVCALRCLQDTHVDCI